MIESAYEILKIARDATPEEARKAFVRNVRRYPPEGFPEKFMEISGAYRRICLDDAFLSEFSETTLHDKDGVSLAGFLWGDKRELREIKDAAFAGLSSLIGAEAVSEMIDGLLSEVDVTKIDWRGISDE
jgi:curved DNA-binding protein CbpA